MGKLEFRPGDWEREASRIQEALGRIEAHGERRMESYAGDPLGFLRDVLRFEPTEYQRKLAETFEGNQFFALCWCRQSGKSWMVSALLLYYALTHPKSCIALVGPSFRQTKRNIDRMASLLENVWGDLFFRIRRTCIRFRNGSMIEAYPNNPDTIRGPTLHAVWWDECNFTPNDVELFGAILFTLAATDGKLLCSSTPWNTDSMFWKMFNHEDYSRYVRFRVAWSQAVEPNGPLKRKTLSDIEKQSGEDRSSWKREMEAQWAEDDDVWLPQSLIVKCIGTIKTCGKDLSLWNDEVGCSGLLYAGLDLGKYHDYSVLCVVDQVDAKILLRFLKIWRTATPYGSVIGYVKMLQDRWGGFGKIKVDQTGIGEYVVEDMKKGGIQNVEGVFFSPQRKQEMASQLKEGMMSEQYFFPHFSWEKPYPSDYVTELNRERFQLNKDGTFAFSHPTGTHDDTFWATALAVSGVTRSQPFDLETVRLG